METTNDLQKQLVDYDDVELDESAQGLLSSGMGNSLGKIGQGLYGHQFNVEHLNSGSSTAQNSLNASNNLLLHEEKQRKQLQFTGIHSTGFKDFLLRPELMKAVVDCGFEHPSEVQQECIPQSIMGVDVLCQAKSGMGKTAVFVLTTLHQLGESPSPLSVLVLCHTRELAFQIKKEYERFLKHIDKEKTAVEVMFGGQPFKEDIKKLEKNPPTILVGTPGRILSLAKGKHLELKELKHFVLDECDKMLEALDMRADVQSIFKLTPHTKQVQMFSATMNTQMRQICKKFMKTPFEVTIDNETGLTLHGLQQYFLKLEEKQKNRKLVDMLDALQFNQVVIFVKTTKRADALNKLLVKNSFPAMCIHSGLSQSERISHFEDFKSFKKRIMVATDVFGRGIDVERVNIVVNYDMPDSSDQYLHRVGRAGRFGTKGLSVSFVSEEEDEAVLSDTQRRFEVKIKDMPASIESSTYMNS